MFEVVIALSLSLSYCYSSCALSPSLQHRIKVAAHITRSPPAVSLCNLLPPLRLFTCSCGQCGLYSAAEFLVAVPWLFQLRPIVAVVVAVAARSVFDLGAPLLLQPRPTDCGAVTTFPAAFVASEKKKKEKAASVCFCDMAAVSVRQRPCRRARPSAAATCPRPGPLQGAKMAFSLSLSLTTCDRLSIRLFRHSRHLLQLFDCRLWDLLLLLLLLLLQNEERNSQDKGSPEISSYTDTHALLFCIVRNDDNENSGLKNDCGRRETN